ncbi:MAG TPA: hypothetical protein H9906_00970 [Candidatus Paenalcaligenes intestinipullorum]|uniref:Uncharacterized protein n=1 Tax=Candidatus Paenalcaligenes intestinipullorum TaxID=2838718 RepID=A0A9D2RHN2_9BURK|nr:hypothetical protein [Candidatus Paenalcaligenes intestinipullorum]
MKNLTLFLRRAGAQRLRAEALSVSRLSVICPRNELATVRKRLYTGFKAAGLQVTNVSIDHADSHQHARACVTISCPPELRTTLMDQARAVQAYPEVVKVQWEPRRNTVN